ncbi:hypothetical protein NC651_022092 [Populus alba x Populus x berolinensis]|nr:hypothetical protein NC651_021501 [Populus alba x Populus x berolinensis]KAJ6895756.1 hypothetical protein NC651_022092 [Populus alba x Populus x berolinensis]
MRWIQPGRWIWDRLDWKAECLCWIGDFWNFDVTCGATWIDLDGLPNSAAAKL